MFIDRKKSSQTKSFNSELNEGFSNSWIFNVPIDLSFNKVSNINDKEIFFLEKKSNLSDNIRRNYLPEDLINFMSSRSSSTASSNEDSFSDVKNINQSTQGEMTRKSTNSFSRFCSSFNQSQEENNSLDEGLNNGNRANEYKSSTYYEEEGKKEINNNLIFQNMKNLDCKNIPINKNIIDDIQLQNCNINIYNPYINYKNIFYPPLSSSSSSLIQNNKEMLNENYYISNEKDNLVGKLPSKIYYDNSNPIKNNMKIFVNNSNINTENLGDNFPTNFSQISIRNNILFNQNNNLINNISNSNVCKNLNNSNLNLDMNTNNKMAPKVKKNKKKKKKKIDDEYTVEMFGRRGWICEGCNNFNYESRKKCNRCKIPKKPLKKTVILDNKGNKIIDNIMNTNHKDDWNCYNCGNVNYAFRLNCNRCQSKRENFPNNESQNENKTPAINLDN
jgi:hypothetical protein